MRTGSRFLIVGGLSTVIELLVFNLCFYALGWDLVPAKVTGASVALINAYFGNREWAFRGRQRRDRRIEVLLFLCVNLACLALGAGIIGGLGRLFGTATPLTVNLINLASIAIVVLVRFALYHWVVFRANRSNHKPGHSQ